MAKTRHPVIVIGGGVAGLTAARTLGKAGQSVILIEGRDRFGGRIWTHRVPGFGPIELGAEAVHGRPPELWSFRRRRLLGLRNADGTHWLREKGRTREADDELDTAMECLASPVAPDVPIQQHLQRNLAKRKSALLLARSYAEGFFGANPRTASALAIGEMMRAAQREHGDEMYRPTLGYDRLVEDLVSDLRRLPVDLRVGTAAETVTWKKERVHVSLRTEWSHLRSEAIGTKAVVTVPISLLTGKDVGIGALQFRPAVPAISAVARTFPMSKVIKVIFRFHEGSALTKLPFVFAHSATAPFLTFWKVTPDQPMVIVAWGSGPKLEPWVSRSNVDITDVAVRSMARTLGIRAATFVRDVESVTLANWTKEPFTRGAYSVVPVGAHRDRETLAMPVNDTLYFAGEATDADNSGTVHGAMRSGVRAAKQVLASLRR